VKKIQPTDVLDFLDDETVFLYPTDTIYGLGGLVTRSVVEKINKIKQRPSEKSYSLIAPSFSRVEHYFTVENNFAEQRNSYQTTYPWRWLTILLPLRATRPRDIDFSLVTQTSTVGIRFIDHPFQDIISKLWKPIITTSANLSGQPTITHPDQLLHEQKELIDFCLDEGTLDRPPSVIIDYKTQKIIRN
jgi:L-threonylcarbamoyladenylate synthase